MTVMASENSEFANGAAELARAKALRGSSDRLRAGRGVAGVTYGLSAYGSPIGNVTGIYQGAAPASTMTSPEAAPVMQTEQFAGGGDMSSGGDAGGGTTSG